MAKNGYTQRVLGQNRVPGTLFNVPKDSFRHTTDPGRIPAGCIQFSSPHPIMATADFSKQQPTHAQMGIENRATAVAPPSRGNMVVRQNIPTIVSARNNLTTEPIVSSSIRRERRREKPS